jgi:hypothetical protein
MRELGCARQTFSEAFTQSDDVACAGSSETRTAPQALPWYTARASAFCQLCHHASDSDRSSWPGSGRAAPSCGHVGERPLPGNSGSAADGPLLAGLRPSPRTLASVHRSHPSHPRCASDPKTISRDHSDGQSSKQHAHHAWSHSTAGQCVARRPDAKAPS